MEQLKSGADKQSKGILPHTKLFRTKNQDFVILPSILIGERVDKPAVLTIPHELCLSKQEFRRRKPEELAV